MNKLKTVVKKIVGVLENYYNILYSSSVYYIRKSNNMAEYKCIILLIQIILFIIIKVVFVIIIISNLYKLFVVKRLLKGACFGILFYNIFEFRYLILIIIVYICYQVCVFFYFRYILKYSFIDYIGYLVNRNNKYLGKMETEIKKLQKYL